MIPRRHFPLLLGAGLLAPAAGVAAKVEYATVTPGRRFRFPADHGAHPQFRMEWWYVTGWLRTSAGTDLGFQVTVFRTRPDTDPRNPSAFAPRQVIFAHAALSDPAVGRLLHDQRIARAGFGLAEAAEGDADLVLDDWTLKRRRTGVFHTHVAGADFTLDLDIAPTQPVLLQGQGGYSRKGPRPDQSSYYYSLPHLRVTGAVTRKGRREPVSGEAWLDREWSSSILDSRAVGWDWLGLNLDDGSALTAFQVRDKAGRRVWAGGSLRTANGTLTAFEPGDVRIGVVRRWTSPRTRAVYPVERTLEVRVDGRIRRWTIRPLFDDQELDGRRSGGPIYWEGAVRAEGGRGYLELTGYAGALTL